MQLSLTRTLPGPYRELKHLQDRGRIFPGPFPNLSKVLPGPFQQGVIEQQLFTAPFLFVRVCAT